MEAVCAYGEVCNCLTTKRIAFRMILGACDMTSLWDHEPYRPDLLYMS